MLWTAAWVVTRSSGLADESIIAGTVERSFVPTVRRTLCHCQMSNFMTRSVSAPTVSQCYTMHHLYWNVSIMEWAAPMALWWIWIHWNLYHWWVEVWTVASSRELTSSVRNLSSLLLLLEPVHSIGCFIGIWLGNCANENCNFCFWSFNDRQQHLKSDDSWQHQARRQLPFCV